MGARAYQIKEGWKWLSNSPKFHYFQSDGRSICGRWFTLLNRDLEPDTGKASRDDCKACRKQIEQRWKGRVRKHQKALKESEGV